MPTRPAHKPAPPSLPSALVAEQPAYRNRDRWEHLFEILKTCKYSGILDTALQSVLLILSSTSRYRLSVRQQPIAARACGFGERDRRVIDPPIVIQLFLTGYDPTSKSDVDELNYPKVMQVALHSEYGGIDVTSVSDPNNANKTSRRLMGSLVASSKVYIDPEATASSDANARSACLFAFFDLSCRQNGRYRLYFSLMRVNLDGLVTGGRFPIVGTVESDVFEVFSAKDFPGTRPSTPLTKALKAQGSAVSVKKGHESKQEKKTQKRSNSMSEQSGNEDSDVEEGDLAPAKSKKRR